MLVRRRVTLIDPLTMRPIEAHEPHQEGLEPTEFPTHEATMVLSGRISPVLTILAEATLHRHAEELPGHITTILHAFRQHGIDALNDLTGDATLDALEALAHTCPTYSASIRIDPSTNSLDYASRALWTLQNWAAEEPDAVWSVVTLNTMRRDAAFEALRDLIEDEYAHKG